MSHNIPVTDRVKKSFSALSSVASALNVSSDKLSNNITALETELKKLSLGVSSSVIFDDRSPDGSPKYDFDKLLYSKTNGKWGFAIESMSGDERADTCDSYEVWPFNEAPRGKRVKAVKLIPDLLDKLAKDAGAMVADVDAQAGAVAEITAAISSTIPPSLFQQKLAQALKPPANYDEIAAAAGGVAVNAGPHAAVRPGAKVTAPKPLGGKTK
jgi:hypothetical protein